MKASLMECFVVVKLMKRMILSLYPMETWRERFGCIYCKSTSTWVLQGGLKVDESVMKNPHARVAFLCVEQEEVDQSICYAENEIWLDEISFLVVCVCVWQARNEKEAIPGRLEIILKSVEGVWTWNV